MLKLICNTCRKQDQTDVHLQTLKLQLVEGFFTKTYTESSSLRDEPADLYQGKATNIHCHKWFNFDTGCALYTHISKTLLYVNCSQEACQYKDA
jgi:hypothetical protein